MRKKLHDGCRLLLLAVAVGTLTSCAGDPSEQMDAVPYQGKTFKLAKTYTDYDDYKNAPNNLPAAELPEIERLLCQAKVPRQGSREKIGQAVFDLQFPGYGVMSLGEKAQPDGSHLCAYSVEIPNRNKERFFVYRQAPGSQSPGRWDLVADFVYRSDRYTIGGVSEAAGTLTYRDDNGKIVQTAGGQSGGRF